MKHLIASAQYRRDYKLSIRRNQDLQKLKSVIDLLIADKPLPAKCRPHKLKGQYRGLWECHIAPDWLLIYNITDAAIELFRLGSHSDLFE